MRLRQGELHRTIAEDALAADERAVSRPELPALVTGDEFEPAAADQG